LSVFRGVGEDGCLFGVQIELTRPSPVFGGALEPI
jgi:hypothetical protein